MSDCLDTKYIGRFAPSPTGPLHMGSLVAALGSYLRARSCKGKWLLRMEDLDPLREVPGAADSILQILEAHGLYWDDEVVYQSHRQALYQQELEKLVEAHQVYACTCTRKALKKTAKMGNYGIIYPGNCRHSQHLLQVMQTESRYAIRVRTDDHPICFTDKRCGEHCQQLESELGDFIVKRSDGYFAYQFAVVVDDEAQHISEVVRGEDLLDNTQRQIHLQHLLGYSEPKYYHLPMVTNKDGQKLSKQTHAIPLNSDDASNNLIKALSFLGIFDKTLKNDSLDLLHATPESILHWALEHSAQML